MNPDDPSTAPPQPADGQLSLIAALGDVQDQFAEMARYRAALERLENVAETYLVRGEFDDAAATAEAAAQLAEVNHPGVLASPRLEQLLERISRAHLPSHPEHHPPASPAGRQRVLIVVTETYETGGHTRMVWRWIGRDPTRCYSVATTAQRGVMPEGIATAVAESGGEIVNIQADAPPLERAAVLRAHARAFDLIVLLDHPFDAVPSLAFAGMEQRPPIVMFNHGDHLFWLGRDIVDVLMCIREEGVPFALRRGFPAERLISTSFPVFGPDGHGGDARRPVDPHARQRAREQLLEQLGWPKATVLLVSVGSYFKWEGPEGYRLLDWIGPVLDRSPEARLLVVGAPDEGQWAQARQRTNNQVVALGRLAEGVGDLLTAADVFLDSMPIGGMAAPAEAAAHGLPVLTGGATSLERDQLTPDEQYGATRVVGARAYRELLSRLIADQSLRSELGDRARTQLAAADDRWEADVERTFELALTLGAVKPSEFSPLPAPDERDAIVAWLTTHRGKLTGDMLANIVGLRSLIATIPQLRPLYESLEFRRFRQTGRYATAFSAPAAEPAALQEIVALMRLLSQLGLAQNFVIAMSPAEADQAIPVLEAALADGPDFELNLELAPDPPSMAPAGALIIG